MTCGSPEHREVARRRVSWLWLVIILAALATVPRLFVGYGTDGDATRGAVAAQRLMHDGEYRPSRLPGYPLFEGLLALLVPWGGHAAANAFVLLAYVLMVWAFYRLGDGRENQLMLTGLLALTPIILVNAASTMDYAPGLSMMVCAYLAANRERIGLSALLTALAVAFRLSNALFVIPLGLFFLLKGRRWPQVAGCAAVAVMGGLLFYTPVLMRYGLRMFSIPASKIDTVSYVLKGGYNLLALFGLIATVVMFVAILSNLPRVVFVTRRALKERDPGFAAEVTTVVLFLGLFICHSDEAAYLLPIIPWLYLLLARWLPSRQLGVMMVVIAAASLLTVEMKGGISGRRRIGFRPAWGYVVQDYLVRRELGRLREGLNRFDRSDKAVVMTGMGPALTFRNPVLSPVPSATISPELAGESNALWHRIDDRDVYLTHSVSIKGCAVLRRLGYDLYMFSEAAPSAIQIVYHYDPYKAGIRPVEIMTPHAFYRQR